MGTRPRTQRRDHPWRAAFGIALVLLGMGCASQGSSWRSSDEIGLAPSGETWDEAALRATAEFERGGEGSIEACAEGVAALLVLGDAEAARNLADRGLGRHPGHPVLLEARGNALEVLGFRRAAEGCYDQALESDPERHSTLFARARLRLELGLATAARMDIERCLKDGQRDADLWLLYGRSLAATGSLRLAFDSFTRAFDLGSKEADCMVTAASLYFDGLEPRSARDRDLATAWLQRAIALEPANTRALYLLGAIHEERGEVDAAVRTYTRAIERDRKHLPSLSRLAELHCARGEPELAAEMARRALKFERRNERRARLEELAREPALDEAHP